MPERAALDLFEILRPFDRWLGAPAPDRSPLADTDEEGRMFREPVQLGWGPARWSASTVLARRREVSHDVNGYYRALGVHWRANRRELREAYQARDGQSSAWLTYVLRQLLDPVVREAYDMSPLGQPFLDDYTNDQVKKNAAYEAARRTASHGSPTSAEQVLDEWGYRLMDPDSPLDTVTPTGQDQSSRNADAAPWGYSSYAWKTLAPVRDEQRLRAWQEHLVREASGRTLGSPLSIGFTGVSDAPFTLKAVKGEWVVFFAEDEEPSAEVAGQALDQLLHIPPVYPTSA